MVAISTTSLPAGAAPSQTGGDDTSAYQAGWSWTYAQVYTLNDPGTGFFSIQENVTYTVQGIVQHTNYVCPAAYDAGLCTSSTAGATAAGTYTTYAVGINGTVTGGSGTADGESATITSGTVTGTEYLETSNLATVEVDQTQSVKGTVSVDSLTLGLTNDEVYTPAQVTQDYRLHSGDQWLENTDVYDNGVVSYAATGLVAESGTDDIDTFGPVNATATDTSTTVSDTSISSSALPVDSVNYNDTVDNTSETRTWSNTYHNLITDNYLTGIPEGTGCTSSAPAECINLTMNLTAASVPAPTGAALVSETLGGLTSGLACPGASVTVSGTLASGTSGTAVKVGVDQSTITPNAITTTNTTTGAGGAYSATVTAPTAPDGLNKPAVNGSFGVEVTAGSATDVATLEVAPPCATTTTYTGATSAQVGTSATVSASLLNVFTGAPVSGATIVFSLSGQAGTASAVTGSNGVASTTLPITATPNVTPATLTASFAGNAGTTASAGTSPFTVNLDPTATSITPSEASATIGDTPTFTSTVTTTGPTFGALSGSVTFTADGAPFGTATLSGGSATSPTLNTLALGLGEHTIVATYSGNTDYNTSTVSLSFDVHKPLTVTTTALSITPASGNSVYGQTVTLNATVSPTVDNTNAAVSFYAGNTLLGTQNLSGGSPDTASMTVSTLAVGSYSLTADYNGDNNVQFAPSDSNPVALTVAAAGTTTAVTLQTPSGTPVAFQPVSFGITVSPPVGESAVPTGTVQVAINGVNFGGPLTLAGGTTTVSDSAGLSAGSTTITATYSGDSGFNGSSGKLIQAVNQASTTTTLVSSTGVSGSVVNEVVTLTANVTPQESGNPTGTVTFYACPTVAPCATSIGQLTLTATGAAGAQAQLEVSNLPEGDNYITASYGGDTNFGASASAPPFDQVVSPPPPTAATSTTLSGSTSPASSTPNSSVYGQSVTFTATVSVDGSQDAVNAPSGTVQFLVDGTDLGGPVTLVAGPGSPTTGWTSTATSSSISSLAAGGHAVIATYSGLGGSVPQAFDGSGAIITQGVQQAATTVSGSAAPNPAAYGAPVTITAQVLTTAPGAGVPGGSVQFSVNGTAFGTPATVNAAGVATSGPDAGLLPGTYSVTFVSSGDVNTLSSSGSTTFVVQPIPTTTLLSASPNPVIFGSPETLTATVSHSTGPGTPTGTVTFKDGSTTLAVETVASGAAGSALASYTTSTLATGTHTLTAVYSGSPTFGGSTSSVVSLVVGQQATEVTANAAVLTINLGNLLAPTNTLSLSNLTATLTTTSGAPVAGQTLTFTAVASTGGPVVCTGVTNSQGAATCSPSLAGTLQVDLSGGFTATYAGNASYGGSHGSAGLITIIL
ncbi:MAG TPA: Ig-like domain-containing protein [Acidimicrobiales bacterium]